MATKKVLKLKTIELGNKGSHSLQDFRVTSTSDIAIVVHEDRIEELWNHLRPDCL